jgi:hypothetical protein
MSDVIARSEATKQSILSLLGAMDCFAEPVIGRRFAPTRWLAMTVSGPLLPFDIRICENSQCVPTHYSSSLRTQGPITTGVCGTTDRCNKYANAALNIDGTAYGSLRSQGRQGERRQRAAYPTVAAFAGTTLEPHFPALIAFSIRRAIGAQ